MELFIKKKHTQIIFPWIIHKFHICQLKKYISTYVLLKNLFITTCHRLYDYGIFFTSVFMTKNNFTSIKVDSPVHVRSNVGKKFKDNGFLTLKGILIWNVCTRNIFKTIHIYRFLSCCTCSRKPISIILNPSWKLLKQQKYLHFWKWEIMIYWFNSSRIWKIIIFNKSGFNWFWKHTQISLYASITIFIYLKVINIGTVYTIYELTF